MNKVLSLQGMKSRMHPTPPTPYSVYCPKSASYASIKYCSTISLFLCS